MAGGKRTTEDNFINNGRYNEIECSYTVVPDKPEKEMVQLAAYGQDSRSLRKSGRMILPKEEKSRLLLELFIENQVMQAKQIKEESEIQYDDISQLRENSYVGPKQNTREILLYIANFISKKGFVYSNEDVFNFYLSLKTKPFLILTGISGTGKTKLVKLFAEAVGATGENGRFKMISVRPEWKDSSELFGYKDQGDNFIPGQLTSIIMEAIKPENRNKPYFVCLDDMNLAKVEDYLGSYLSLLESREFKGRDIVTEPMFSDTYLRKNLFYNSLYIPDNLYLVGTVNMEREDNNLSRKVLDRASLIELSQVNLQQLNFSRYTSNSIQIDNDLLKARFLHITDAIELDRTYVEYINEKIISINNILKKGNRAFGYRVRDEIIFYMLENKIAGILESENVAFDYAIMQKILPAIIGKDDKLKYILIELYNYCNPSRQISVASNYADDAERFADYARYKRSARKIAMLLSS